MDKIRPNIGIIGFPKIISLAKRVTKDYKQQANFKFITGALDNLIPIIKDFGPNNIDICIAGPGNANILKGSIPLPVISFFASTRSLIQSIEKAKGFSKDIAIIHSEIEKYDLLFLEKLLRVKIYPYQCHNINDYNKSCYKAKLEGYKAIIGGSYSVEMAESLGIVGCFSFGDEHIFHDAVHQALNYFDVCNSRESEFPLWKLNQIDILLQNINEGVAVLENTGRIIYINEIAGTILGNIECLGIEQNFIKVVPELDHRALKQGKPFDMVIARGKRGIFLEFFPIQAKGNRGMIVVCREAQDKIGQNKDKDNRTVKARISGKLRNDGFVARYTFKNIIGNNIELKKCIRKAQKYALSESPVLLYGETGTGKEMFAHAIHNYSSRRDQPFVTINSPALPSDLLESELFGYEKGAFTGAHANGKKGLVEAADHGTLFLDEICSLNYSLQAKLLRLLEEKEYVKIGGNKLMSADVRIITSTNKDLEEEIKSGKFRKDLYYRLNTLLIKLAPLRERVDDIPLLFNHFLYQINPSIARTLQDKIPFLHEHLTSFYYSGNIRELKNLNERFCIMLEPEKLSRISYLKKLLMDSYGDEKLSRLDYEGQDSITVKYTGTLKSTLKEAEKAIIMQYLRNNQPWKIQDLSDYLGIERTTLWRKLKDYGYYSLDSRFGA